MSLRFKIDEDLPVDLAALLRDAGHDAATVLEQELGGAPDDRVWEIVQSEGRVLVSADKGFADVRLHPPGVHCGIILLRLQRESRQGYISLVRRFIEQMDVANVEHAITVVTPHSIRTVKPRDHS